MSHNSLLLSIVFGLFLARSIHGLTSCLDNRFAGIVKTVPCTTSCLTTYDIDQKTVQQSCADKASCSTDHLYIEAQNGEQIGVVKHCCVSQDNCNTENLAQRVYMPLPFGLSSCYVNNGVDQPSYASCTTSCEVVYNKSTKQTFQQCSAPKDACKKDEMTFDANTNTFRFCCLSSNNCNVVDVLQV